MLYTNSRIVYPEKGIGYPWLLERSGIELLFIPEAFFFDGLKLAALTAWRVNDSWRGLVMTN